MAFATGYFDQADVSEVCEAVKAARPDLLLVGMGNPLQEYFIAQHGDRMGATVAIGVGALFDFMVRHGYPCAQTDPEHRA